MSKEIVLGGQGTGADSADDNGGGYERGSAVTWTSFQGANGGPIHTATAGTIDDNGGNVRITSNGNFAVTLDDIYAYCDFSATYPDVSYKILSSTVNSITIDLAWSTDVPTANVNVGGALATVEKCTATAINANNVLCSTNKSPYTTANGNNYIMEAVHVITGGDNPTLFKNRISWRAVDPTTGDLSTTRFVMDAGGLNTYVARALTGRFFFGFRFTNSTGQAFNATGGQDAQTFTDCEFDHVTYACQFGDEFWAFKNCHIHDTTGGFGGDNQASADHCLFEDNSLADWNTDSECDLLYNKFDSSASGTSVYINYGTIIGNVFRNASSGATLLRFDDQGTSIKMIVRFNDFDGVDKANLVQGIDMFDTTAPTVVHDISQNIFVNLGLGMDSGVDFFGRGNFDNNNFWDNTLDYGTFVSEVTRSTFVDPDFEGVNDYRLKSTSALRDTAFDWEIVAGNTGKHSVGAFIGGVSTGSGSGSATDLWRGLWNT